MGRNAQTQGSKAQAQRAIQRQWANQMLQRRRAVRNCMGWLQGQRLALMPATVAAIVRNSLWQSCSSHPARQLGQWLAALGRKLTGQRQGQRSALSRQAAASAATAILMKRLVGHEGISTGRLCPRPVHTHCR